MSMRRIAKLAGVSSATVSRVIHSSPLVSDETAERVRRILKEQQYFPNTSATTLKYGRSQIYGVIIPDITNPFFPEFVKNFEAILVERDLEILLATTDFHAPRLQQSIRRMLVRRVDGVAFLSSEEENETFEALVRNHVPVVTADRRWAAPGVSDVSINFERAMKEMVQHLRELGHRRIAWIGGSDGLVTSRVRRNGFIRALRNAGLTVHEEYLRVGNYRISGGEQCMSELLEMKQRPTAVAAANDLTAIGALRTIHRRGLSVPGAISVVGCDDIEMSDLVAPPLTTMRISREDLANTFFRALEHTRKEPRLGKRFTVQSHLIVRASTAAPPGRNRR